MASERCTICDRAIEEIETPCALADQIVCRECHDRARPICPYCQIELPRRPVSKSKCARCGRKIIVRTGQRIFPSIYLTAEQAKEVDRYKSNTPTSYGCTQNDFAAKRAFLKRQLGRTPTADEVIKVVNDEIPATDAQLSYARGVGLDIPDRPTKNGLSGLLHSYECLRDEIRSAYEGITREPFDGSSIPSGALGELVSSLLGDDDFMSIVNMSKRREFGDRIATRAARKQIAAIMRMQWAEYLQ